MNTNNINIGITLSLSKKEETMWVNGIKMNAIFLMDALMQSNKQYNVYILNTSSKIKVKDPETKLPWDTNKYKIYDWADAAVKTDLLIMLGTNITRDDIIQFRSYPVNRLEKRVISYKCGNNYVIEMERALFASDENDKNNGSVWSGGEIDDVWMVPQQEYQNKHYYDVFERVDSKAVPFIWSPMFLDEAASEFKEQKNIETKYLHKEGGHKRVVCFEPNNNVVKYSMIPTLIVEKAYRDQSEVIEQYTICSGMSIGKRTGFVSHIKHLDIYKDKKLKVDGRYPMPAYLADYTDVVISHQWENPLNYAYLDAFHFNYPMVHNAEMVKDAGYFYEDFNIEAGAEQLKLACLHHVENIEQYEESCVRVKSRYMASENTEIIGTYDKLIHNLWENKHDLSHEYDWKTNLYKR